MLDISSELCSLTIHTIQLIQHNRRLRSTTDVFATLMLLLKSRINGRQKKFWQHHIKDYPSDMLQISKQLSEEYERIVNPEKVTEDTKLVKIKEETKFWQHHIKDYPSDMLQISKQLSEEYERIVNPEKVTEDTKLVKIKEETDSSYGSRSTKSLMGSSPVFNQHCKKRMRKI
ncbi:STAGA complex 65 subunit gamma [Sciurus carolinensis]|uniref:STAGA complex 65 subunit gamma n=1 Tax=Sciurus carolinensis TaxID=30640 RepID=A0AA41SR44_SCICA|nr:STAGA complex 65 subunit gamma [Sciurus carolinensis]